MAKAATFSGFWKLSYSDCSIRTIPRWQNISINILGFVSLSSLDMVVLDQRDDGKVVLCSQYQKLTCRITTDHDRRFCWRVTVRIR